MVEARGRKKPMMRKVREDVKIGWKARGAPTRREEEAQAPQARQGQGEAQVVAPLVWAVAGTDPVGSGGRVEEDRTPVSH